MSDYIVINGDCLEVMDRAIRDGKENTIDSIVTDPPYGLKFMGKQWDHGIPGKIFWEKAIKLLKPGGHLLAFGGSRTYHRLTCAIEDAGFEIRDCLMWLYGTGFPKSMNVSKAIDKAAGADRKVVGSKVGKPGYSLAPGKGRSTMNSANDGSLNNSEVECEITTPATDEAKQWDGWGTALKPAWEPIILARKPLGEKTVAKNVLKYDTGGINVDGCRIGIGDEVSGGGANFDAWRDGEDREDRPTQHKKKQEAHNKGRWPANVILTHHPECECVGMKEVKAIKGGNNPVRGEGVHAEAKGHQTPGRIQTHCDYAGEDGKETVEDWNCHPDCPVKMLDEQSDSGGASRFFYCPKASKKERTCNKTIENKHPTVKPKKLMRYLCRLITPPNGRVLDPFMGSGSTGMAALEEGFDFVGIEMEEASYETAKKRLEYTKENLGKEE